MKNALRRYAADAEEASDELLSRIAGLDIDDWEEYQKDGIQF